MSSQEASHRAASFMTPPPGIIPPMLRQSIPMPSTSLSSMSSSTSSSPSTSISSSFSSSDDAAAALRHRRPGLEPLASANSWSSMSGTNWQPFSGSEWTSPLFFPSLPTAIQNTPDALSLSSPPTYTQFPSSTTTSNNSNNSNSSTITHASTLTAPLPKLLEPMVEDAAPVTHPHKYLSIITEQVIIPFDKQKVYPPSNQGPSVGDLAAQIGTKTGTTMDVSVSKLSKQLCFLIKGKPEQVKEARRELLSKVAITTFIEMTIPRECRRHILGAGGKTLQTLSTATHTKIRVPRTEENSDTITITGDFEGIELARKEIESIVQEKTSRMTEKIFIDKLFHPFLYGVQHQNLHNIMEATRTKIIFPGPTDPPTQISVVGDRENVAQAIASLNAIYQEKLQTTSVVSLAVKKNLHKFLIGQKGSTLQEIFAVTQCAIELPSPNDPSELVMIRGPNECLVKGLAFVMEKANSTHVESFPLTEIQFKYISLRERPKLKRIEEENEGAHVVLSPKSLEIQGKKEPVARVKSELLPLVHYLEECHYEHFTIPLSYHKHIIGRRGQNIARIQTEFGVDLIVPNESEHSEDILLVGKDMKKIDAVRHELSRILKDLEGFVEKDLSIEPDHLPTLLKDRFLRDLLVKYEDLAVRVRDPKLDHHDGYTLSSFHEIHLPSKEPHILHLRAQKETMPTILAEIRDYIEFLKVESSESQPHFLADLLLEKKWTTAFKQSGALFHILKTQYDVKITHESKNATHDSIHIQGTKSDALAAKNRILKGTGPHQTITRLEFQVPVKYHLALIGGPNAKNMKTLMKRYHVSITWSRSTTVQEEETETFCIEGSPAEAESAKQELSSLLDYEREHSHTLKFIIPSEYLRFIVGKNGAVITEIRESTNTKIDIQSSESVDATVCIEGSERDIAEAKLQIENIIEGLQKTETREVVVAQKYHKLLIGPFGSKVKALMEKAGNRVRISFPKEGTSPSDVVVLRGPPEDLNTIEDSLLQSIQEIDSRVTIEECFPFENRGSILGPNGSHLRWLMELHAVDISLSSVEDNAKSVLVVIQGTPQATQSALEDIRGSLKEELPLTIDHAEQLHSLTLFYQMDRNVSAHRKLKSEFGCYLNGKSDTGPFYLYGPKSKLATAKQYILDEVLMNPHLEQESCRVSETIDFPKPCHKFIVGKQGATLRAIIQDSGAEIRVPASSDPSSLITVSGSKKSVQLAIQLIDEKCSLENSNATNGHHHY